MSRANIYGPLNMGMAVLQRFRWKFSHKRCSRLYSIQVEEFYFFKQLIVFDPLFGDLWVTYELHL